jgi:methylenetetrahydrofolate reductase (NADPH)
MLGRTAARLSGFNPAYFSLTYGAGGSNQARSLEALELIRSSCADPVAAHLTCVGASREATLEEARGYSRMGDRRIVALRGDPPKGETSFVPHPDGFASAAELVAGLRSVGDFEIAVAAYPEKHPEAASIEADIDNLKRKLDAGGACAITQFFFDNEDFLRFRDKCVAAGIDAPIHPGILPVENFEKMLNFAGRCQARVPEWMHKAYARAETAEERYLLSVSIACDQMDGLMGEGVEHLHVYTLNNPDLTFDVCRVLGYAAAPLAAAGEAGAA